MCIRGSVDQFRANVAFHMRHNIHLQAVAQWAVGALHPQRLLNEIHLLVCQPFQQALALARRELDPPRDRLRVLHQPKRQHTSLVNLLLYDLNNLPRL